MGSSLTRASEVQTSWDRCEVGNASAASPAPCPTGFEYHAMLWCALRSANVILPSTCGSTFLK